MSSITLPEGWLSIKIADVSDVQGGKRLPKGSEFATQVTAHPYLRVTDFGGETVDVSNLKYIDDETFQQIKNYIISKNDLYISIAGTIGLVGDIPEQLDGANLTENAAKICNIYGVEKVFLKRYLNSSVSQSQFDDKTVSSGQPKLALFRIRDCDFPLPPLAEQQQIAQKLDELLAQVDTLKTRLDAIPKILKRFRQSVLAAAVSGRLTEEWRGSRTTYFHDLMQEWGWTEIPKDWCIEAYEDLVDSRLGKMLDKAKNSGVPTAYLGNINVRWDSFDLENLQEILISEDEQIELGLRIGDVFICEGGEPGRCAIWKTPIDRPVIFQKALHRARVKDKLLPEWLVFNLKNDANSLKLEQLFTGTTIKHLTGKALKKYPIRVPPLKEQTEIVRRVEQLFAYADQIEQRVKDAQARGNHLTQSILAKAFRGELTADWRAQNPELISGENSAAALLGRIRVEREAALKPKRK